ncbi:UPF0481 protein At3g47200-like [Rutidosis leptorrhynchoides]|uniref:UPF0481 protein At3g47200-like n=1 Tax=Rutidosis leptorrhynchoides TaxID=125765 RepID=UPI003A99D3E0
MANNTDMELGKVDIVDQAVKFLLECEVKGQNRDHQPCIFKVPSVLKDMSPDSYNPRVISIGPLHREAIKVQAMEERKATYLHNLLGRLKLPREETLKTCVMKITSLDKIQESYGERMSYTDVELAQTMVMDGFFILEFLHNYDEYTSDVLLAMDISHDLILLENQIPFFVLQDLFECTILKYDPNASLIELILKFLDCIRLFVKKLKVEQTNPDHILGLLHKCYQPEKPIQSEIQGKKVHSAAELDRACVKFKPSQDPNWAMAIKVETSRSRWFPLLWAKPTLKMPVMNVNDFTESIMRNLIVYEQSSNHVPNYITSYAIFIDTLVDTKEDIVKLVDSGVIINDLGSSEEVVNIFNHISKDICVAEFFYNQQWAEIEEHYNGYWPRNLARLRRTYFNSPWNIVALIAGIVLFALTIVQTIFTIKAA